MSQSNSGSPYSWSSNELRNKKAQPSKLKWSLTNVIRTLTKDLRISDEMSEKLVSSNQTPPLEPESPIATITPERGPSSRHWDPLSKPSNSQSRWSRLRQSLQDDWEAGIDPKHYHGQRAQAGSNSNSAVPSRAQSRDSSREPPHATDNLNHTPSRSVSKKNAKAALQHVKAVRKLERQESQRQMVKHHREVERGFLARDEGSPRYAPLHMLGKANEARNKAQEAERSWAEEMQRRRQVHF